MQALVDLNAETHDAETAFSNVICDEVIITQYEEWCLLEGLVSRLWQSWCRFMRSYCIAVTRGHVFPSGRVAIQQPWAVSEDIAVGVLTNLAKNGQMPNNHVAIGSHLEVTWGDIMKLTNLFISYPNYNNIHERAILGLPEAAEIQRLQKVRNCIAHWTAANQQELIQISTNYSGTGLNDPTAITKWVEPQSQDYVFVQWTEKLRFLAAKFVS